MSKELDLRMVEDEAGKGKDNFTIIVSLLQYDCYNLPNIENVFTKTSKI